jgi:pimeloyl-ACP methyl ester carboxylesterase
MKARSPSFPALILSLALLLTTSASIARDGAFPTLNTSTINGTQIAWTQMGEPEGTPMLMIMGLGASHKVWGEEFSNGLVDKGFRLVLLDNRDVGGSQKFDEWGEPILWWNMLKAKLGLEVSHAYTLSDMGDDAVALLDLLQIERAHVLGASMGGMIAQTIAIEHPERVISLISIMSSSGAPHLPQASKESVAAIRNVAETSEEDLAEIHAKGFYPAAIPRQLMAIMYSGDRSAALNRLQVPTLVIHGEDDPLLPLAHGQHTAEVIPAAQFVSFPGMAHNIPDDVRPAMLDAIEAYVQPLAAD